MMIIEEIKNIKNGKNNYGVFILSGLVMPILLKLIEKVWLTLAILTGRFVIVEL